MDFDTTPYVPVSSISEKISTLEETLKVEKEVVSIDVPQQEETTEDVEDENDTIAIRRLKRVIKKPGWLTKDLVVSYALTVIDNDIFNTFSKVIRSSESDRCEILFKQPKRGVNWVIKN